MNLPAGVKPGRSAGVLLYRWTDFGPQSSVPVLEVYLVHPGGPYFHNKDAGYWGIAKGLIEDGEDEEATARREFAEETGFEPPAELTDLGTVTTYRGKVIHAFCGEWTDPADPPVVVSNTCPVQWPPKSGKWIDIPEVDEGRFYSLKAARAKMAGGQQELLDRLVDRLGDGPAILR
ncbi:MAG: NUDIX domain-containing protein [Spirochaetaceae bacterium]|nr:NUDIX domain-containing protein [Spirochaetaceae bacterium]